MALLLPLISIIAFPFVVITLLIIILASSGQSLGIRRFYVSILLKIFQWGKEKIQQDRLYALDAATSDDNDEYHHRTQRNRLPSVCGDGGAGIPFHLADPCYFVRNGIESIIEDDVTRSFDAAELPSWNLLTRTNQNYQFLSVRLTILWTLGFFIRYCLLLPFRLCLFVLGMIWLIGSMGVVGYLPNGKLKRQLYGRCAVMAGRILARTFSAIITFHNAENQPKPGGVCVANHTSPIDALILMTDNNYALVGQKHGGILGIMQQALNKGARHIWFERGEIRDRTAVSKRLNAHVEDPTTMPILIFPEGTCVNNTSVFMFKKGSFELDCVIYPVAIKYDPIFGDPFWNSSKQTMMKHLLLMMTSWAIVCDVWYLPPTKRREGESAVEFANRVKSDIARQGGLVDLEWDGMLKRELPKPQMRQSKQREYSNVIKRRLEINKQATDQPNGNAAVASDRTS